MASGRFGGEGLIVRTLTAAAVLLFVSACESPQLADFAPKAPRIADFSSLPTNPTRPAYLLGPPRLVGADGSCAAATADAALPPGSGIALEMSECDVIERAGSPTNFDVGASPAGERTAVLTYLQGERAGIYRFVAGRLKSVERVAQPDAPARPAKKSRAKT